MPVCKKCSKQFPNYITIDGKVKNISKRSYCTDCSPFGKHNTKKLVNVEITYHCNRCGETNPNEFYGRKRTICKACKNKETYELSRKKRHFAIEQLGGKCIHCGFDSYECALDIHHTDPNKKDDNFSNMRHWSYKRILEEIKDCVLACKNCHSAFHNGDITTL